MTVIDVEVKCNICEKIIEESIINFECDDCKENTFDEELVKDVITDVFNKNYLWEEKELYCGFSNDEEKEMFMRGIKHGHHIALFWIAENLGLDGHYEELEKKESEKC